MSSNEPKPRLRLRHQPLITALAAQVQAAVEVPGRPPQPAQPEEGLPEGAVRVGLICTVVVVGRDLQAAAPRSTAKLSRYDGDERSGHSDFRFVSR